MIKVTRISEKNRLQFLPAVDTLSLAVCDVLFGAYDEKTNTACGILAAESVNNGQTGYSLTIRHIYVDDAWRRKGVGTALVNALMDLSVDAGARAILCFHLEPEEDDQELSLFFEALDFKRTKDSLPVYGFRLSEIDPGTDKAKFSCVSLISLDKRKWSDFLRFAQERSAVINVRSYYDENISFFAYDRENGLRGALLCSHRGGVLYVDEVLTAKEDRISVIEALLYHAVTEAGKLYSGGTEIGITLSDPDQEMVLKELTGFKAEKVGSFVAHVVQ